MNYNRKIDRTAAAAYTAIVRALPEVKALQLRPYSSPPGYEIRMGGSKNAKKLADEARKLRDREGVPFWDAVILIALNRGDMSKSIVSGVSYHQEQSQERIVLSREEILDGALGRIDASHGDIALLSEVLVKPQVKRSHLPLLDLRCPPKPQNLRVVYHMASHLLKVPFIVLETEHSYHVAGAVLLTFRELVAFMGQASLFGPIVDRAYIGHQLIDGFAALRVSGGRGKTPYMVASTLAGYTSTISFDHY